MLEEYSSSSRFIEDNGGVIGAFKTNEFYQSKKFYAGLNRIVRRMECFILHGLGFLFNNFINL